MAELIDRLRAVAEELSDVGTYEHVPSRTQMQGAVDDMLRILFPSFYGKEGDIRSVSQVLSSLHGTLSMQIRAAFALRNTDPSSDSDALAMDILASLPTVRQKLDKDIQALYEGDPAASGPEEVLLSYPGFFAIAVYRLAHEFYIRKIPYLSRMMTEYAHGKTGIDIHAGATIGEYFFIDHGTGIVIGETTVIGDRVKLYQGVTLGAKSFELDENGNPVKGIKRHPNIGNDVVIYAGATILGGRTTVGDGCTIGGNVWLTHSVDAGTTLVYEGQHSIRHLNI